MADAEVMRFRIGDSPTIYSPASIDELTLKDMLILGPELADLGFTLTWHDLMSASAEMETLEHPDQHPLSLLLFAITLWASRRVAGEDMRFADAIDVAPTAIHWLPTAQDRKPGKRKGAKKAPAKKATPTSAPAVDAPPSEDLSTSTPPD